jgi:HD-GYP domain-containing protein (c-di-GMP phosphodiesterase class II)
MEIKTMRFVPVNCIREGMTIAKQLLGKNGELLLNVGAVVRSTYINKIKELGYNGIYVEDDLSRDIVVEELINDKIRTKSIKTLKNAFIGLENGKQLTPETFDALNNIVDEIIEEVLANKDIVINMIDMKVFDDYTFYHSLNVSVLSLVIGVALNLNKKQLCNLALASLLHDIGKVFVPKEILNKPGKLSEHEFSIMSTHSAKGYEYLREKSQIPVASYVGILHHHEKYNGSGYPLRFQGEKISLFGRIISVADVYDALTSDRPYRKALIPSEAIEFIMGGGGSMFDPEIAACFVQKIAPYPVGTCVTLSDGRVALVMENYSDCCVRPKLKVLKHDGLPVKPYLIDLKNDASLRNTTVIGMARVV